MMINIAVEIMEVRFVDFSYQSNAVKEIIVLSDLQDISVKINIRLIFVINEIINDYVPYLLLNTLVTIHISVFCKKNFEFYIFT